MAHGTNCPILHFIIIRIIVFLFQPASTNLIAYFPLEPMSVCFLHYWPALPCFKKFHFITCLRVTATSFIISVHVDDHEAIQIHIKQPITEHLLHYQLSKPS